MSVALGRLVRQVRRRVDPSGDAGDSSLLARWVDRADQAAFELLLWRHGPMVWDTCRRVLRHEQDAEDAFQAAFLALARKASSIRQAPSLAGWLYRVAHRAALTARERPRPVESLPDLDRIAFARPEAPSELTRLLDEEIARLPERYREAFVLCYLEGLTTDEAAAVLGCPRGTVGTRVAWARQKLRERLSRRGVELPTKLPACLVPPVLVETVLETVAGGPIAPAVADLCQGVIAMLCMSRMKSLVVYLLPLLFAAAGLGGLCLTAAEKPGEKKEAKKPEQKDKPKPAKPVTEAAGIQGVVKDVSKDGKTLTVLTQKKNKNDDEKTVELKLDDKTKVLFSGVGVGEATVKVGYQVSAWLVKDSTDLAASVFFTGEKNAKGQKPDYTAAIREVGKDGKSVTLVIKVKKNEDGVEKTIKLTDKTVQTFYYVGPNEAKLEKDLVVSVWLAEKSEDTAARVSISGKAEIPNKKSGGGQPSLFGTVSALGKDGKSFTLAVAKKNEEGTKVELKLGEASKQVFNGVAAGKAKIEVGQQVAVWVSESAKDTVSTALFQPAHANKIGDLAGKVTAVADDGKSFTILMPATKKNEEGKEVQIKLAESAYVIFNGVAPGGAKIAKDQSATVHLAEGSKDSAAMAVFSLGKAK